MTTIRTVKTTYAKCVALKAMDNGDANIREVNAFLDQEIDNSKNEAINKAKNIAKDVGKEICNKVGGKMLDMFMSTIIPDPNGKILGLKIQEEIQKSITNITSSANINDNIQQFTKEGAGVSTLIGSSFNSVKSRINDLVNNNIGLPIDMDPKEFQTAINGIDPSKLQQSFGEDFNTNRIANIAKEQKEGIKRQFSSAISAMGVLQRGGVTYGGIKARIVQGLCDVALSNGLKSASKDSLINSIAQYANLKENALDYLCNEVLDKVPFGDTFANLIEGNSLLDEIKADIMYFNLIQKMELKELIQPLI